MRTVICVAGLVGSLLVPALPALAQSRFQYVGPNECLNCHDHQDERQWYEKQEILEVQKRFPKTTNAGHINALKQLEGAKSDAFAKAIGLADKYAPTGACVKCHATVYQGEANAGVSCESCHGPASGYLKPHQTKDAYAQSIPLGLVDIVGKIATWAQQCTGCHVMDDQRLVTAGHPSGDEFDLGAMYAPVSLHFAKKYSENDVRGISRDIVRTIIATRRGGAATTVARGTPPAEAPPAPIAAPAPITVNPTVANAPPPASVAARGGTVVPPVVSPSTGRPAGPVPAASAPATAAVVATPPVATPAVPAVPPVEAPVSPPATAPTAAVQSGAALPASLSGAVAVVQGRLIATLTALVARGATVPVRSSTPAPSITPYAGPDAALLQLQRDAIALALEVLATPPPPPSAVSQPR